MGKLFAALCASVCLLCTAQAQSIDTLVNRYNKKVPQEKVYLQFDNQAYVPGETIWFKGYLQLGAEASWMSRSLYVDWRDEEGNLLQHTVSPVIGFGAFGSFVIPATTKGNVLHATAYTKWMLNFDSAFLFHKSLKLLQQQPAAVRTSEEVTLTFFPEGGDLVEGLSSYVAFKANTSAGMPAAVSGIVKSSTGAALGSFQSWHNGMGKLQLTPQKGEKYTAEWKDASGKEHVTPLPSAKPSGLALSIANTNGARIFSVERQAALEDRYRRLSVVATMNQQVVFRAAANFTDKSKLVSTLPVKDLPSGILQFTVFDVNQIPVAERLLFVNNHEYKNSPRLFNDSFNTAKRAYNVFELEVPDSALTSLSLSVTDGDESFDASENIISRLLLTGDLRGYVHNPAYYFSGPLDSAAAAVDLVMMTHGWRRFAWEHVFAGTQPALTFAVDSNFISVSGQVTQGRKKEAYVNLLVAASDSTEQLFSLPLAADGTFGERNLVLFDTTRLYVVTTGTALKERRPLSVDNQFLPVPAKTYRLSAPPGFGLSAGTYQLNRPPAPFSSNGLTLGNVTVRSRVKTRSEELNDRYASPLYNAVDAYQLNVVDDPNASNSMSVLHYIEGKVAGLRSYNMFGSSVKPGESEPVVLWRGEKVIFMLNEMPADINSIFTLSMSQVALIKLFRNSFFGFKTGSAGNVVAVYTKKGNDEQQGDDKKGLSFVNVQGYTAPRQFYSPDYSGTSHENTVDRRRTLLWQPNINTGGGNRTIKVSFYNNDYSKSFRVTMEGMTEHGKLLHVTRLFK